MMVSSGWARMMVSSCRAWSENVETGFLCHRATNEMSYELGLFHMAQARFARDLSL
jgi:hypothetical protein